MSLISHESMKCESRNMYIIHLLTTVFHCVSFSLPTYWDCSLTRSILNVKSSNKHILLEMVVRWEEPTHQFLKLFIFRFWKSTNFIENIIFSFPTKYIFMNELYTSSWSQVLVNYETKYNKHFEGSCELLSKQCVISIWQTVACTFLSHLICFPCTFLSHVMSIPCTFLKVVM